LYHLSDDHVASLDHFEDHPYVYERQTVLVRARDGSPIPAITYIMPPPPDRRPAAPRYLKVIHDAYADLGFETHTLLQRALWSGGPL